ncbi:hypothetical protein [Paenibacillus ginsengihumi]|uniref:hypothetical protein n=1 Tax=Paenibacillus ginsengihumi TaxID=431596 RepID=UPI00037D1F80|nr:hypothetical protein [Paenibacillus ginsengihumi]
MLAQPPFRKNYHMINYSFIDFIICLPLFIVNRSFAAIGLIFLIMCIVGPKGTERAFRQDIGDAKRVRAMESFWGLKRKREAQEAGFVHRNGRNN